MFEDVPAGHYAAAHHQALSGRLGVGSDVAPPPIKYEATGSPLFFGSANPPAGMHQGMNMSGCTPCYPYADHQQAMKEGSNQQQELAAPTVASFLQQLSSNDSVGMHANLDYSGIGLDKICQESRAVEASCSFGMRSLPDLSSFSGYRSNAESTSSAQPYLRSSNLSVESSKQEQDIVSVRYEHACVIVSANVQCELRAMQLFMNNSFAEVNCFFLCFFQARSSSSGSRAASERKKRPSEERTSTVKKSKQEGSKASPPKV
jgi:hypothetical protein